MAANSTREERAILQATLESHRQSDALELDRRLEPMIRTIIAESHASLDQPRLLPDQSAVLAFLEEIRARATDDGRTSAAAIAELTTSVRLLQDLRHPGNADFEAGTPLLLGSPLSGGVQPGPRDSAPPAHGLAAGASSLRNSSTGLDGARPTSRMAVPPGAATSAPDSAHAEDAWPRAPYDNRTRFDDSITEPPEWELSHNTQRNSVRFVRDVSNEREHRPMVGRGRDHTPAVLNGPGGGAAAFMVPPRSPYSYPAVSDSDRARHWQSDASRGGGVRGSPSDGHRQCQRAHRTSQPGT